MRTGTFGLEGRGDLIARKKITQCPKPRVLFKRTQIAVKTKIVHRQFSRPNESVIIPKIVILDPRIPYDLDRQSSEIRNL